jgi:hypothetical protein
MSDREVGETSSSTVRRARKRRIIAKYLSLTVALVLSTLAVEYVIFGLPAEVNDWQSLLFVDGGLWIGLGALIGGGLANTPLLGGRYSSTPNTSTETYARRRLQDRESQMHSFLVMFLVGGVFFLILLISNLD